MSTRGSPTPPQVEDPARRRILELACKAIGLIAAGEAIVVAAGSLAPRLAGEGGSARTLVAGSVEEFEPGSVRAFPGESIFLVRLQDGGFLALSSRCTHLGCTVAFDEERRSFPCPCHGSTFDLRGDVIGPPAMRALDLFPVVIENGLVKVDTSRRVERSAFAPDQAARI